MRNLKPNERTRWEYVLEELGCFCECDCKAIKEKAEGTFMNIEVEWSNCFGNCTLIITSDYRTDEKFSEVYEDVKKEVVAMFLNKALSALRK
jgi:hypothetical protein